MPLFLRCRAAAPASPAPPRWRVRVANGESSVARGRGRHLDYEAVERERIIATFEQHFDDWMAAARVA
jgi:hypothetical protein